MAVTRFRRATIAARAPQCKGRVIECAFLDHSDLREAISMEKRYFTSDLSNLS
jgi:hypothetical protein